MSRSYKKNLVIKDHPKGAKKDNNKRFRRKVKSKLKGISDDTLLPLDKSEVMNDYDVSDYKFIIDKNKPYSNKILKGKNKRLNK